MKVWLASLIFCVFVVPFTDALAQITYQPLQIQRDGNAPISFDVEVVTGGAELEKGLMFRRELAADKGMLFDFGRIRRVMMWMKNTYIPLDMLFIDAKGKIVAIEKDTVPESTEIIDSGAIARYVLEVNAGTSERLGINIGDIVSSPAIDPADASLPPQSMGIPAP